MIALNNNQLVFRFPEVRQNATCTIEFQRTLRIPDDNRDYPLPPGLGRFPLHHVDDFSDRVPTTWNTHGGIFLPMYQAEALWVGFSGRYPMAVKVAAGKINAVTGKRWHDGLATQPQDYVVAPGQPWLDGFCVKKGLIRQFVAMPLGEGYTAEEQLAGVAEHGGVQIIAYPMKAAVYEDYLQRQIEAYQGIAFCRRRVSGAADLGLAPGGLMRQELYADDHGFDAWEKAVRSRCFIHIANSRQYRSITNARPPTEPPTAWQYTDAGLPWFEYYDADGVALRGAQCLAHLDSVAGREIRVGGGPSPGNEPVSPSIVQTIVAGHGRVREGSF